MFEVFITQSLQNTLSDGDAVAVLHVHDGLSSLFPIAERRPQTADGDVFS